MSAPWRSRRQRSAFDHSWGIIVLGREDKVLLLQHRNGQHWSFCKGHKEDTDTSDIHTAARELFEETKLRVPKLWMENESWEEYRNTTDVLFNEHSADEAKEDYIDLITPQDATRPRMFREQYSLRTRNRNVDKCVDFYVARVRDPLVLQTQTKEISDFCWLPLGGSADFQRGPRVVR